MATECKVSATETTQTEYVEAMQTEYMEMFFQINQDC